MKVASGGLTYELVEAIPKNGEWDIGLAVCGDSCETIKTTIEGPQERTWDTPEVLGLVKKTLKAYELSGGQEEIYAQQHNVQSVPNFQRVKKVAEDMERVLGEENYIKLLEE